MQIFILDVAAKYHLPDLDVVISTAGNLATPKFRQTSFQIMQHVKPICQRPAPYGFWELFEMLGLNKTPQRGEWCLFELKLLIQSVVQTIALTTGRPSSQIRQSALSR